MTSHLPTVSSGRVFGRIRGLEDLLPGEQPLAHRDRRRVASWAGVGVAAVLIGSSVGRETCDDECIRFSWMRAGWTRIIGCDHDRGRPADPAPRGSSSSRCRCRSCARCSPATSRPPRRRSARRSRRTCAEQLDNFLQFRIADLDGRPGGPAVAGPGDRAHRARRVAPGHRHVRVPQPARRRGAGRDRLPRRGGGAAPGHRHGGRPRAPRLGGRGARRERASGRRSRRTTLPSLAVVAKFGFRQVGVQIDDIDGEELVFELDDWAATA